MKRATKNKLTDIGALCLGVPAAIVAAAVLIFALLWKPILAAVAIIVLLRWGCA